MPKREPPDRLARWRRLTHRGTRIQVIFDPFTVEASTPGLSLSERTPCSLSVLCSERKN